jgi:protein-lysine N-methyltransferase EEF2KMT
LYDLNSFDRPLTLLTSSQTYDKVAISALVATLRNFFDLRPTIQIFISGAVRNVETYETFLHACSTYLETGHGMKILSILIPDRNQFEVEEIQFEARPIRDQRALFYATAVPLKILSITKPP